MQVIHDLKKNRTNNIFYGALSGTTKSVEFVECDSAELSHIAETKPKDNWQSYRKKKNVKKIQSFSISDLIKEFKFNQKLDYLSLDTEGSEYDI